MIGKASKQFSIWKSDEVQATDQGISIKIDSTEVTEVFLSWDVVDDIADASEPHYQKEMMEAFGQLVKEAKENE